MEATTVRLTSRQKARLEGARKIMERRLGRKFTQGQAVEILSEAATRNPGLLDAPADLLDLDLDDDPFFNGTLRFKMGKTDARTLDRELYGDG